VQSYDPGGPAIPTYNANDEVVISTAFDYGVEYAVKRLKGHAYGQDISEVNGDVTLNVLKALLSMDTFVLLSAYGGKAPIREMQQKFNRTYEAYIGLVPCDGVYGRGTNTALIKAFQAEEGFPAVNPGNGLYTDGSFGNTTKMYAPNIPYTGAPLSYQGQPYNSTKISAFVELLQFALYLNGFGVGTFDGVFSGATQLCLLGFQHHYALPKTGKVTLGDWMSLFLSSGDPNRSAVAADCAQILTPATVQTLSANGYKYIGRYLTGTYGAGISKAMTVQEANNIINGGLRFFPIYQEGQYLPGTSYAYTYFTAAQGTYDAQRAIDAALALGLPSGTVIYFAVDFDALDSQITSNVIPYFQKVSEALSQSIYKTGIYGTRNVCSRVAAKGYSCSSFVAGMSTGWSGNLGFKIPDDWAFSQVTEYTIGVGSGSIGIDKNAFSGRDQGVSKLNGYVKRAIYVLPGYLGSNLYDDDSNKIWGPDISPAGLIAFKQASNLEKFYQDENSSGTQLHADAELDEYGAMDTYDELVERLKTEFADSYDINFFPYNWLEDINDSVIDLENHIKSNGYSEIVIITHSTGGLLASAFISKSDENKRKVKKAILIAAPLFGTYASILPIERGDSRKSGNLFSQAFWIDVISNNSWVRGWAKNSPTTYQLLPGSEYLQHLPLKDDGNDISSINDYYSVLNRSDNMNKKLTTDTERSHKYFRETVLKGDIVKTLQEVDILLIGTASGHSTTSVAVYKEVNNPAPLIGTTSQMKDIQYNKNGDSTIQGFSAKGEKKGSTTPLRTDFSYKSEHGNLVKDAGVLNKVTQEIRGLNVEEISTFTAFSGLFMSNAADGMNELLKIRYQADLPITATIYDSFDEIVAVAVGEDATGFNGDDLIYDSFADDDNSTEASIYMPNSGYKLVFSYGTLSGVDVDFEVEVSTLDDDGWKYVSVANFVQQTLADGIISTFDGTVNILDDDTISNIVGGTVTNHLTNWELADTIKMNFDDTQAVTVIGDDAVSVSAQLTWTSADESIVTVSSTGVLTAVGYGKVSVSATDGNKSSTCEVTVMQNALSVSFSDVDMIIGEKHLINPTFAPIMATETDMTYTYEEGTVISIDEYGVIRALAAGTITVTGTTEYGISSTFVVNVIDPDFIRAGDINFDDEIDYYDLFSLEDHLLKKELLTGFALLAADMNKDGTVDILDLLTLKVYLLDNQVPEIAHPNMSLTVQNASQTNGQSSIPSGFSQSSSMSTQTNGNSSAQSSSSQSSSSASSQNPASSAPDTPTWFPGRY
jgi:peptidoglycan hydrolase-like protein with peptidoglycan-binding domain